MDASPAPEHSFADRIVFALLGGLTGAGYGLLILAALYFFTEHGDPSLIGWSAGVFSVLGFLFGNFIVEAFLGLIWFVWGFAQGWTERWVASGETGLQSHLKHFLLLGFGTGAVLSLWWYW